MKYICNFIIINLQTGNGFIKVAREERGEDGLRLQIGGYGGYADQGFRSNPATNDWIPSSGGDYFDQVWIIMSLFSVNVNVCFLSLKKN